MLCATIAVATPAALELLARDYRKAGVRFFRTPRREAWGARAFVVADPDGNLVMFAGPAA